MNINKVSTIKFGNYQQNNQQQSSKPKFESMNESDKLNVIYGLLKDIRINQEYNAEVVTANQANNHTANKWAFQILTDKSITTDKQHELIADAFERNSIGQLPGRQVDQIV